MSNKYQAHGNTTFLAVIVGLAVLFGGRFAIDASPRAEEPPASAGSPSAQEGQKGGGVAPNCRAELEQLCPGVKPGEGRMRNCLKENKDKLSPTCQQQIREKAARTKQGAREFKAACEADVKQFCPNVQPGGGRIRQCLQEHAKELSSPCAQALQKRPMMQGETPPGAEQAH